MIKLLTLFVLFALMISCKPESIWELHSDCEMPKEALLSNISKILLKEDLFFKNNSTDSMISVAESEGIDSFHGLGSIMITTYKCWSFEYFNNRIIARAFVIKKEVTHNGFISDTTYLNDDTPQNVSWYWNVRSRLEELCGSKILFHMSEKKKKE